MPTSFNHVIPLICDQLEKRQPKKVLDIGVGLGKYGLLAREYGSAGTVDGVEGEPRYITPTLKAIYNHLYVFQVHKNLDKVADKYDLILFIDCIEHLSKEDGHKVLQRFSCPIIVSTPVEDIPQHVKGFPLEDHISNWTINDFSDYPHEEIKDPAGKAVIVVINP